MKRRVFSATLAGCMMLSGVVKKVDKKVTWDSFDVKAGPDGTSKLYLLKQIARMDGDLLEDGELTAVIWLDGENKEADPITVTYDYSGARLEDKAQYKDAELKLYTSNAEELYGKRSRDLYDASSQTVKLVTGYTGFSSNAAEQSGYYLPLQLEFDVNEDAVVTVQKPGKNDDGTDKTADIAVDDGKLVLVQRIADVDGKLLRDQVEVTVYPQGKGKGMPSKTCTYDLTNVKLAEGLTVEAVPVKADAVKIEGNNNATALFKTNLNQVQSIVLKDGVLTVKADVDSAVNITNGGKKIPVLFTATVGEESVAAADEAIAAINKVTSYGGVSKTHILRWVDLSQEDSVITLPTTVAGLTGTVTVKVVNISGVPTLKSDAAVTVEDGVMTGLTAQKDAVTVAEVKGLYAENGGSIIIETAGGRELKDGEKVVTGSVIILKDKDDE